RTLQRFLETLIAFSRISRVTLPDEHHDLPAAGQSFFDEIACLASGSDVIGCDIESSVTARGVRILRDNERLFRRIVYQLRLIVRIDRTDSDAIHTHRDQVIYDPLLLICRAAARHFEIDRNLVKLGVSFFDTLSSDRPVVRRIVRDERELEALAAR